MPEPTEKCCITQAHAVADVLAARESSDQTTREHARSLTKRLLVAYEARFKNNMLTDADVVDALALGGSLIRMPPWLRRIKNALDAAAESDPA